VILLLFHLVRACPVDPVTPHAEMPATPGPINLTPIQSAAEALYNAGFRGNALAVMLAVAGRETGGSYSANSLNVNQATGDYSVGAWQINYDKNSAGQPIQLDASRVTQFGPPSTLLGNLQAQANAVYKLVGGNSLSGLSNWALQTPSSSSAVPQPTTTTDAAGSTVDYSITKWLPEAMTAADQILAQNGINTPTSFTGVEPASGSSPLSSSGGDTGATTTATSATGAMAVLIAYGNALKIPSTGNIVKSLGADVVRALAVRAVTVGVGAVIFVFGMTLAFGPPILQLIMDTTGLGKLVGVATRNASAEKEA
jgi:hypothetical protein